MVAQLPVITWYVVMLFVVVLIVIVVVVLFNQCYCYCNKNYPRYQKHNNVYNSFANN